MKRINTIIESNTQPKGNNTLWIKPKEGGGGKELVLRGSSLLPEVVKESFILDDIRKDILSGMFIPNNIIDGDRYQEGDELKNFFNTNDSIEKFYKNISEELDTIVIKGYDGDKYRFNLVQSGSINATTWQFIYSCILIEQIYYDCEDSNTLDNYISLTFTLDSLYKDKFVVDMTQINSAMVDIKSIYRNT